MEVREMFISIGLIFLSLERIIHFEWARAYRATHGVSTISALVAIVGWYLMLATGLGGIGYFLGHIENVIKAGILAALVTAYIWVVRKW